MITHSFRMPQTNDIYVLPAQKLLYEQNCLVLLDPSSLSITNIREDIETILTRQC